LKIRNRAGPTCQPQRQLNRPHRSLACVHDTACGDVAVTVYHRWPPPTDPRCLIPYITASRRKNLFPPSFHSILFPRHRARSALLPVRRHSPLVSRSSSLPSKIDEFPSSLSRRRARHGGSSSRGRAG
jgi:hypothetical protein